MINTLTLIEASAKTLLITLTDLGDSIAEKAWLMVKNDADQDDDGDAILSLEITTSEAAAGVIDGAALTFNISAESGLEAGTYEMAVKVLLASGAVVEIPESRRPVRVISSRVDRTS